MERRLIIRLATAFFLASILFTICAIIETFRSANDNVNSAHSLQHSIIAFVPVLGVATRHPRKHFIDKQAAIKHHTKNNAKISIFQGRGAVRNLAIFHILVAAGPLSMGDIQRRLNRISGLEVTYYASLNKRIHALVRGGYIGEVKIEADQASGFKACQYGVRTKFYLAYYLNGRSRDEILSRLNEPNATVILGELINADSVEA